VTERTYLMIKPDAVQRRLVGHIIEKIENKGLKIVGMKFIEITKELASTHYKEHVGKSFYNDLIEFITSSPVIAMVLEGNDAISITRKLAGKTNPEEADFGSIRGDYGIDLTQNIVHTSDSIESAKREIGLFFKEEEIIEYNLSLSKWISKTV